MLCTVDSGSVVRALNAVEELPDHPTIPHSKEEQAQLAETACGGILKVLGRVEIEAEIDGVEVDRGFNHMKISSTLLGVRKIVRDRNEVHLKHGGGHILNLRTGKKMRILDLNVKMKVKRIEPPQAGPGFHGPVASGARVAATLKFATLVLFGTTAQS